MELGTAKPSVEELNAIPHHFINTLSVITAEVASTRERDMNELIDEIIHTSAAERHLKTNRIALAYLKRGNRESCRARCRLLPRNLHQAILDEFELFLITLLPDTGRNDNLLDARALHRARVAKFLRKSEIG